MAKRPLVVVAAGDAAQRQAVRAEILRWLAGRVQGGGREAARP